VQIVVETVLQHITVLQCSHIHKTACNNIIFMVYLLKLPPFRDIKVNIFTSGLRLLGPTALVWLVNIQLVLTCCNVRHANRAAVIICTDLFPFLTQRPD